MISCYSRNLYISGWYPVILNISLCGWYPVIPEISIFLVDFLLLKKPLFCQWYPVILEISILSVISCYPRNLYICGWYPVILGISIFVGNILIFCKSIYLWVISGYSRNLHRKIYNESICLLHISFLQSCCCGFRQLHKICHYNSAEAILGCCWNKLDISSLTFNMAQLLLIASFTLGRFLWYVTIIGDNLRLGF